jgi:hypothetical protein
MSMQDWAAIADVIGAAAIVVTLIYLAVQIRDGNREARANTVQAAIRNEMEVGAVIAPHAGIWDKVLTGTPLDSGAEIRTAIILYNLLLTEAENRYVQFRSGYLDEQTWESRAASLHKIVQLPIYETWRRAPSSLNHSAEFLDALESMRVEDMVK